ncbi:hypothetical protein BAE44_0007580 [Dichanthelium oligosanthes]|uniref:DUF642 domain-containing protein n=1 Tax=Dichanthelium oligosanthes TaxID=888268 RepID=A0A1E5W229_9POAL|nr:hypothetical protein BAE44_0007580 [Dichanthelium oligosanthes]
MPQSEDGNEDQLAFGLAAGGLTSRSLTSHLQADQAAFDSHRRRPDHPTSKFEDKFVQPPTPWSEDKDRHKSWDRLVIGPPYYSVTFSAERTCGQDEQLNVSVAPESGLLPIQTVYTSSGWDSYSYAFKARHSAVWLAIHNPGDEEDPACGPLFDSIAIKALDPPHLAKGNMLRNGDFEVGPFIFPDSPWGVLVPLMDEDDVSPLPGWMVMSDTKSVKYEDAAHYKVPHGSYAVELAAGREAALVQEVSTTPGRWYSLSFSVRDAGNGCEGSMALEAYAAWATARVPYNESRRARGHGRAELEFAAVANRTRVVFQSYNHHMKPDGTLCGAGPRRRLPRQRAKAHGAPVALVVRSGAEIFHTIRVRYYLLLLGHTRACVCWWPGRVAVAVCTCASGVCHGERL